MGEGSFSGCTFIRGAHLRGGPLSFSTSCLQTRNPVRDQPLCSTFLGCGVLRLFVLLHTAAVRALLLCFAAVYWPLSRLLLWGSLPWLPHCWWPSSAVLLVLVPPLARSVFGPGPDVPVRASCSWPRPGIAGPGVRSVRRSQCRRPGAGFGVGLWCHGAYWRLRPNTNMGLQLRG